MLDFVSTNQLWPMMIAMLTAFLTSMTTFRFATKDWFGSGTRAKYWLVASFLTTLLGAWFIYSLSLFVIENTLKATSVVTALSIVSFVLFTFLFFVIDLFLRSKKDSSTISRAHLSQLALVDTLTGLPNRRALMQQLEAATRRAERTGDSIAIAFIDIDHLKPINDTFGHQTGDQLLQAVGVALASAVRSCDAIARIGGDEFIALIEEIKSDDDCVVIIERMQRSIRDIKLPQHSALNISASIGVAMFPKDGHLPQLMDAADAAMYYAKKDGKNQFRFFDAAIAEASNQLLEIQQDLKHALANDELVLHYQVKIDSLTREPVGAEALLRWEHPIRGLLHPAEFMQAAERFGLSYAISDWVVEECCRTLHRLNYLHVPFNMTINLSHQQLKNAQLVNEIQTMLKRFNLPTTSLMFEVTESAAIKNSSLFNDLLSRFKAANIKVAIDDFGTQPSSLAYLQNLQVNELKLDPVFIADIATNHKTRGIVQAVIELAHVLELNVVAEGVETEDQRRILTELGCDQMQGYLISRPVSEEHLFHLLKTLSLQFEATGLFSMTTLKNL